MQKILFYNTHTNTAKNNMAIDEALFLNASEIPILRFYQWAPKAISLGRFQNTDQIDLAYCEKNNIDIVKRITGGKAVLHDQELTYSFIAKKSQLPESIPESYAFISQALILGLAKLGITAEMNPHKIKDPHNPCCFAQPSLNEIIVNTRKIIGSAQKRINDRIIQHGSILIDCNYQELIDCFKTIDKNLALNKAKQQITSINQESSQKYTYEQITNAFLNGFSTFFQAEIIHTKL
jgi:lipoate-protein ligase A